MIQDLKLPVVFTELPIKVYPSRISKISECVCARARARVFVCVYQRKTSKPFLSTVHLGFAAWVSTALVG